MRFSIYVILFFLLHASFIKAAPNHFQELADELFASGNKEKAFRTYGDAIKSDRPEDNNYQLFLSAGDCAFAQNYKIIALNYYSIAAQKGAPCHLLIKHIKETYCNGDIDCIGITATQIIAKQPALSDSLSQEIAMMYYNKNRFEKAIPILKEQLKNQPDDLSLKSTLANALLLNNDGDSAKVLYPEILDIDPNHVEAKLFLGNYYYIIAKEYEQSANYNPTTEDDVIRLKNYYTKAAYYLEQIFATNKSEVIRKKLVDIYSATKNKEKLNLYK